ncbi:MAG: hypothetical protein R2861_16445 [Desulfobacterales bacterium]
MPVKTLATGFAADHPFALSAKHLERYDQQLKTVQNQINGRQRCLFPQLLPKNTTLQATRAAAVLTRTIFQQHFPVSTPPADRRPRAFRHGSHRTRQGFRNFFAIHPDDAHRIALEKLLARSTPCPCL